MNDDDGPSLAQSRSSSVSSAFQTTPVTDWSESWPKTESTIVLSVAENLYTAILSPILAVSRELWPEIDKAAPSTPG